VPPKFFPQMCGHPKTDEAVRQFVTEFQKWQEKPAALPLSKSA
jgi:transaldolase